MLAWIFWHSRALQTVEAEYREALAHFHAHIAAAAPAGFLGSRVLRYDAVPWLETPSEVYENWYFVQNSAALDDLDAAAIAAFTHDAHARVVRLAGTAISGLYRLRAGSALVAPRSCSWLSKPRGVPYEAFIDQLPQAGAVWSRKMVLGPTPEFCVESETRSESLQSLSEFVLEPQVVTT